MIEGCTELFLDQAGHALCCAQFGEGYTQAEWLDFLASTLAWCDAGCRLTAKHVSDQ